MLQVDTLQASVEFGLARRDVTPPVGIYLRLWPRTTEPRATGVHRPLTATAIVLRNAAGVATEADEQIIVAIDLCLLRVDEQAALTAEIRRRTGVAGQLMCHYSHTHSTGWASLVYAAMPGGDLIAPYLDYLASQVVDAVTEARGAVQAASIVFGRADCNMGGNRDLWDSETRQFVCGFNPDGPTDPTVLVGRVTNPDGDVIATLVNYACHPTTLAWQNSLISPDFPGATREVVEGATGAPCVFLQGASGDVGPREGFVGDPAIADRNGRELGFAAMSALESLPAAGTTFHYEGPSISGTTLGIWAHVSVSNEARSRLGRWQCRRWTVPLPYRQDMPSLSVAHRDLDRWQAEEVVAQRAGDEMAAADCRSKAEQMTRLIKKLAELPQGPIYNLPVMLLQTGDAFWLGVEAEHYNVLQRELRRRFPGTALVVMTLMDGGRVAYLPTADTYGKGLYQETIAVLAPGSLETLIEAVAAQMTAWGAATQVGTTA